MRLRCNVCGKPVSTVVPDDTVFRGWVECPECISKSKGSNSTVLLEALKEEHKLILNLDGMGNICARVDAENRAKLIVQTLTECNKKSSNITKED